MRHCGGPRGPDIEGGDLEVPLVKQLQHPAGCRRGEDEAVPHGILNRDGAAGPARARGAGRATPLSPPSGLPPRNESLIARLKAHGYARVPDDLSAAAAERVDGPSRRIGAAAVPPIERGVPALGRVAAFGATQLPG